MLPEFPPYEGLHPLVVHFPIALLLTAPLFVIAGLLWTRQRAMLYVAAAALMTVGTAGAFIAAATGEAAAEAAQPAAAAERALERHEELSELARNLFAGVTIVAVAWAAATWRFQSRIRGGVAWGAGLLLLAAHSGASLVLANAAHEGGRLVHQFGVHAPSAAGPMVQHPSNGGDEDQD